MKCTMIVQSLHALHGAGRQQDEFRVDKIRREEAVQEAAGEKRE